MTTIASKSLVKGIIPEVQQLLRGSIAIPLLATLAVPCAIAADAPRAALEEIIVTAQRREENLQKVPMSVTALSGERIRELSASSFTEIAPFIPNVQFTGVKGAQIFIRGIGQTDENNHKGPGVGFYVDGVYMARQWSINRLSMDVERVEILRGPQGTLYGMNTVGGAVNIVTATPTDELTGSVTATLGSFDRTDIMGAISGPLIPGKLGVRLSGGIEKRDGYATLLSYPDNRKIGDEGGTDQQHIRAVLEWTPTEDFQVLLRADNSRARDSQHPLTLLSSFDTATKTTFNNNIAPFGEVGYGPWFVTGDDFTSYADYNIVAVDEHGFSLTANWDLGSWAVKSISAYRTMDITSPADLDGSPYNISESTWTEDHWQASQELLFSGGSSESRVKSWIVGLMYFTDDSDRTAYSNSFYYVRPAPLSVLGRTTAMLGRVESETYGVFGQATTAINSRLNLTTGLRYTSDEKVNTRNRFINGVQDIPDLHKGQSTSAVTGRLALDYQVTDAFMVYASVANGFRAGGINNGALTAQQFKPFDPEYILTYELGARSELFDGRVRLNGSVFYSDYKDIQFRQIVIDPITLDHINAVGNAASAKISGFDFDASYATASFRFGVSAGFNHPKYTSVGEGVEITLDTPFFKVPEWTAEAHARYTVDVPWGELIGQLNYGWKSGYWFEDPLIRDTLNSGWIPTYGLLNARLTLARGERWKAAVFGSNLLDERYVVDMLSPLTSSGKVTKGFGPPREWGVELSYKF